MQYQLGCCKTCWLRRTKFIGLKVVFSAVIPSFHPCSTVRKGRKPNLDSLPTNKIMKNHIEHNSVNCFVMVYKILGTVVYKMLGLSS